MLDFRGKPACECLYEWLPWFEKVLLARGVIRHNLDIYQLIGGAKSSAGTHTKGGAFDVGQFGWTSLWVARQMGADATWHRRKSQGFDIDHAHGVLRGCPHNEPARYQITAVDGDYNGLGNGGRGGKDDGPRPLSGRTWEQGIEWAKAYLAEVAKPVAQPDSVTLDDPRISESSALAASAKYPHLVYTLNDENGPIFAVDTRTGKVVGTFTLRGVTLKDPESLACRADGSLWIGDIGDNDSKRHDAALYVLAEPGPGNHGALVAEKYLIAYPGGPRNAESLLVNPVTKSRYVVSKSDVGDLYRSKVGELTLGRVNTLEHVGTKLPAYVTDACFSIDGRFIFLRQKGHFDTVTVLDGDTWRTLGSFGVPKVAQPESVTADPDGIHIWIGSEGKHSPLIRVTLPAAYRPKGDASPSTVKVDWRRWKLTEPVGPSEHPHETRYPQLASYEDAPYFVRHADGVTFRAPVEGVTTHGSHYPRSELREMDGDDEADWSSRTGVHSMTLTQAITALPGKKPHVVAGQIHNGSDDVIMIRLEGKRLFVEHDGDEIALLDPAYVLGTKFTVKITASSSGIEVLYNGRGRRVLEGAFSGCYFKAGCYTQANTTNGSGYGEVVIYELEVTHS